MVEYDAVMEEEEEETHRRRVAASRKYQAFLVSAISVYTFRTAWKKSVLYSG